jgi:hypothetical protein
VATEAERGSTSKINRRYSAFLKNMVDRKFEANADFRKLSLYLAKLSSRLKVPVHLESVKMSFCEAMHQAARETSDRLSEWPTKKSEARDYLSKLKTLETLLSELGNFDPIRLSEVLTILPPENWENESHDNRFKAFSWENIVEEQVFVEAEELAELLTQTERGVKNYLADNILPKYVGNRYNRRDTFTYALVHVAASIWRGNIRPDLIKRRDRRNFVGLLGVALDSFGYPRSKEQADDAWLYHRVGTYKIWN